MSNDYNVEINDKIKRGLNLIFELLNKNSGIKEENLDFMNDLSDFH